MLNANFKALTVWYEMFISYCYDSNLKKKSMHDFSNLSKLWKIIIQPNLCCYLHHKHKTNVLRTKAQDEKDEANDKRLEQ